MTDGDALFAAILAAPDEDTPRLVYADWLDEHAEYPDAAARAEFIRVQVAQARNPTVENRVREAVLLGEHEFEWLAALKVPGEPLFGESHGQFRRGFVEVVWMDAARFLSTAALLLRRTPVRELRLTSVTLDELSAVLAPPHFTKLDGLDLSDRRLADAVAVEVSATPTARALRVLRLRGCSITHAGALALVNSPFLDGLRELDVSHNTITPAALSALKQRFGTALVMEGT